MNTDPIAERAREVFADHAERNGYPRCAASIRRGDDPYFNRVVIDAMFAFAALTTESRPEGRVLPADIADLMSRIGEAEWGATAELDADGHAAHIAESVRTTAENFGQTEPQRMHGLYIKGSETIICHTGTSPNSPQVARALAGSWNHLRALATPRPQTNLQENLAGSQTDAPASGEVERLRQALIQCGRNAGALLADDVSTDFLMLIPEEVRAKLASTPSEGVRDSALEEARAGLVAELSPLVQRAAGPNGWDWLFPLRVNPVDGKPTIASHRGGNLFRGYIATWQEADLLVALANAAPRILAALRTAKPEQAGAGFVMVPVKPTEDEVIDIVNVVTGLQDANALELAPVEVARHVQAIINRIAAAPQGQNSGEVEA